MNPISNYLFGALGNNKPKLAPDKHKYPEAEPDEETLMYFKQNPKVAGMAIGAGLNSYGGDRRVVVNPYSGLNREQRSLLVENERLRHFMDEAKPEIKFSPTAKQMKSFEGTEYGKPENIGRLKETLVARIITGDDSAGDVTAEQRNEADKIIQQYKQATKPKQIKDMVMEALEMRPPLRK